MPRLPLIPLAALAVCAAAVPASASAAETIGQTAAPGSTVSACAATNPATVVGGIDSYRVAHDGVITEMKTLNAGANAASFSFGVFRPQGGESFKVQARIPAKLGAGGGIIVGARVPVRAGDAIGLIKPTGTTLFCVLKSGSFDGIRVGQLDAPLGASFETLPSFGGRVNVSATLERDADGDGFGDETQDECATAGSTQGACPPPPAPPATNPPAAPSAPAPPPATATAPAPAPQASVTPAAALTRCRVPKLRGLTLKKARRKLRRAHCKVGKVKRPKGAHGRLVVRRQTIKPKSLRRDGKRVGVVLGAKRRA